MNRERFHAMTVLFSMLLLCSVGSARAGGGSYPPVGTWELTVTFPDGHTEQSLFAFLGDGTLIETNASVSPVDTRFTGIGHWKWTSSTTFDYGFREQAFTGSGTLVGEVHVLQHATLSSNDAFTASGAGTFYDLSGNPQGTNNTTSQATRYTLTSP